MRALRAVEPLKTEQLRVVTVQQLMTPEQCAEYLQVEVPTLYVWVSRRRLPRRKVGNLLRFDFEEILAWTKRDPAEDTEMFVRNLASQVKDETELQEILSRLSLEARRKIKLKRLPTSAK